MFRLHNPGIESKIDWLVKNGKLNGKKIIISPWNQDSIHMHQYLIHRWGEYEILIFDDEVAQYNKAVLSKACIENIQLDDSCIALIISNDNLSEEYLNQKGLPYKNIYVMRGDPLTAQDALAKCAEDSSIDTVLDVGCGKGNHSGVFLEYGKKVTGIDAGFTCRIRDNYSFDFIQDDFMAHDFSEQYDLVWCAHVLEHQLSVGDFIKKLFACCKDNGKVAVTVPNEPGRVIEGHVNNWNAGLLMYNIIQCGYSCRHAAVKTYSGNVSVIVPKEPICKDYDYRAVNDSHAYFPVNMKCGSNRFGGIMFDGNIEELNWNKVQISQSDEA
ncbi:MAG: class I SAM-dependent methyltransferase [Lachnospiraceae bacterium]|nr:class I SAM-dependent methyltransferase [Lachnospiraceae bacterium]